MSFIKFLTAVASALICSAALALPVGGGAEVVGSVPVAGFDVTSNPVARVDMTLTFTVADDLANGEAFRVRVYDNSSTEVATQVYTNDSTSILVCGCITIDIPAPLTAQPYSFRVEAVTGTVELDSVAVISRTAIGPLQFADTVVPTLSDGTTPLAAIDWDTTPLVTGNVETWVGYFPNDANYVPEGMTVAASTFDYTGIYPGPPPAAVNDPGRHPVAYDERSFWVGGENLIMMAELHPDGGLGSFCQKFGNNPTGFLSFRPCVAEYPARSNYPNNGLGWWTWYGGTDANPERASNTSGVRIGAALNEVRTRESDHVDWDAGWVLKGGSYGGAGSFHQSMILPDEALRQRLVVVSAGPVHTTFGTSTQGPNNYLGNPQVRTAFGNQALSQIDFATQAAAGRIDHIFYQLAGGTLDNLSVFDPSVLEACETHKIACEARWHSLGPGQSEHVAFDPALGFSQAMFPDPNMFPRLNKPLIVFTNSTGNRFIESTGPTVYYSRGHYNYGLSWNTAGITESATELIIPIKYTAGTGLGSVANPIPDMPTTITSSVSVRRSNVFTIGAGESIDWEYGAQSGTATADADGLLTIDALSHTSSTSAYTNLRLTRAQAFGMVITRSPRPSMPFDVSGVTIDDASNYVTATDVRRVNEAFAETDVVYYPDVTNLTNEIVIYNCTQVATVCAAQEARVSPDATKIAYSVGLGNFLEPTDFVAEPGVNLQIDRLTSATIYIYDIAAGTSTPLPNTPAGVIDRMPEWIDNDTLVISSNRGDTWPNKNMFEMHTGQTQFGGNRWDGGAAYGVSQIYGYTDPDGQSLQLWKVAIDGSSAVNLTPHEYMALRATVNTDGDIYYSSLQNHAFEAWPTAAPTAGPSSITNLYWLSRIDQHGGDQTVFANGHKTKGNLKTNAWLPSHITGGEGTDTLRALRAIGEAQDGRLCFTHYYRGNHRGLGSIYCAYPYADPSIEGCSTETCYTDNDVTGTVLGSARFVNGTMTNIIPWANSQDTAERRWDDPATSGVTENKPVGKGGFMGVMPGNRYQITNARGFCYNRSIVTPEQQNSTATWGEPNCDEGIYELLVPRVVDPFDTSQMVALIDSPLYFERDGDVVATYQATYGQPMPTAQTPYPGGNCYVQVVDTTKAELHFGEGDSYDWQKTGYDCSVIGCAVGKGVTDFFANNIAGLKFLSVDMWDKTWAGVDRDAFGGSINNTGHMRTTNIGWQAMESDGSLKAQVPCDTPLIFQGVDSEGLAIAHDEMPQSLRPGERRTCHGCHDGHSEERYAEIGGVTALSRWPSTLASAAPDPALLAGTESLTFTTDVLPILTSRCATCHAEFDAADPDLYAKIAWDRNQYDMPNIALRTGVNANNGVIRHVRINNPGTGYTVGDTLNFPGCTTNGAGTVSAVGGGGEIEAISLTSGGAGCPNQSAVGTPGSSGSGASLQAITNRYTLHRPYTSKWVAKFARDSLLFWKCRNQRMDGRADGDYSTDIDFGAAHPTTATVAECNTIGRWIDQGIPHYQEPP